MKITRSLCDHQSYSTVNKDVVLDTPEGSRYCLEVWLVMVGELVINGVIASMPQVQIMNNARCRISGTASSPSGVDLCCGGYDYRKASMRRFDGRGRWTRRVWNVVGVSNYDLPQ